MRIQLCPFKVIMQEKLIFYQNKTLEEKIYISKHRIAEFYNKLDGKIYISFSGGKDSTVLMHLVRSIYPNAIAVFCDTGLEFPEIREFVSLQDNVTTIRPKIPFTQVIEKYGWPIVSKEQSLYIGQCQRTKSEKLFNYRFYGRGLNGKSGKISNKWQYLVKAPFKIFNECCNAMKKKPFKKFEKESGLYPIIGTMAVESRLRRQQWEREGCNTFEGKRISSKPLSFWTEKDIYKYISKYDLKISEIYEKGAKRTGCIFCLYGYHMDTPENDRLELLKRTHPKLYDYCMDKLGMREVLEWYPIRKGQINGPNLT